MGSGLVKFSGDWEYKSFGIRPLKMVPEHKNIWVPLSAQKRLLLQKDS